MATKLSLSLTLDVVKQRQQRDPQPNEIKIIAVQLACISLFYILVTKPL